MELFFLFGVVPTPFIDLSYFCNRLKHIDRTMADNKRIFRQGDTASVLIEIFQPLGDRKIKIGLYRPGGTPVFESVYPDDGNITKINDRLLLFEITHEEAMKLVGTFTLRLSIYEPDFSMVKSGEDVMTLVWEKEPVNYNLIQESCRNLNILQ